MRKYLAIFTIAMLALLGSSTQATEVPQVSTTAVASQTLTTTTNGNTMNNAKYRGVQLMLNVTAASGTTPTLDAKLQWQDPISLNWVDISGAVFQRITTTGQRTLTVYPEPEGRGNFRTISGSNPAAGGNIIETVPDNRRWYLLGMTFVLVTDATVINRNVAIAYDDGTIVHTISANNVNTVASSTQTYAYTLGLGTFGSGANAVAGSLPVGVTLIGSNRFRTTSVNLQAADDFGAPSYLVEEWIGNYAATPLPKTWRVVSTIGGGTPSFTFSVAGFYLP